jgi:hypothetical protein
MIAYDTLSDTQIAPRRDGLITLAALEAAVIALHTDDHQDGSTLDTFMGEVPLADFELQS